MREERRQERRPQRAPLNMSFLDSYHKSGTKLLREDLITVHAEEIGKKLVGNNPRTPLLSSTQLRRFFNDVKALEAKIETGNFEEQKPMIKMLKSKGAYAYGRDKIPLEFKNYIDACVDKINNKDDFNGFLKFFESVVGFYYGHGGK